MKKIFLHFLFSFVFFTGAYAQEVKSFGDLEITDTLHLFGTNTTTVTCGTLTLVISGTDPLCNADANGSVSVVASGGVPPYTYNWTPGPGGQAASPTMTGLSANAYVIEVWDAKPVTPNYCTSSINISNPPSLIVNITPPSPVTSCFSSCDGSATANPTGGTPPYTYLWNTVPVQTTALATGLCSQTYSVTVTDNHSCTKVKAVPIGAPPPLLSNGSTTTINCAGNCNGSVSVAPTGGNPGYSYSWSPGGATTTAIIGLCVGNYTCTIIDTKTCSATYTTHISSPPPLTVIVTGNNLLCNGVCSGSVTATVSGGIPSYTYSWSPGGYTTSSVTGLCANTYTLVVTDANGCPKTATITLTQPAALTVAPTGTNVTCYSLSNGIVNANAGGGTPSYTYAWAPGGCTTSACSNLANATYTVTVSDASGCTINGNVTLTQPALLTITPAETDVSCVGSSNGSVNATVVGGTAPYTYSWSPGGCTTSACSGLSVGTYSISVTDSKGCVATSSVTVSSPAALLPNVSSIAALCHGSCNGVVSSSASGGIAPYAYNWSSGCTTSTCSNLCAATYTLHLTDAHGCPATGTVTVSQPNTFSVSIASATPNPLNCSGDCNGTAAITASGGTPTYTYAWSNGETTASVTGLCVGTYSLNALDSHNCPASTSVTFLQPSTLTISITPNNPTCNGVCDGVISLSVSGGSPSYTYSWLLGGQTTSSISGLCQGNYVFTVSDSKGCSSTQTVTLTAPSTLAANASVTSNVSCAGFCNGSATAIPSGGTSPFTYLWTGGSTSQTATGLCAGSKNVLVTDAHGCSVIDNVTINQPTNLSSFISSITPNCSLCNGAASVATAGGTSPYTYLWTAGGQTNSTATGLCTGTYSATITDTKGCSNSLAVTISPVITLTISPSGPSVSCPGSCDASATATPFGGTAPYTYLWNTTPVQTVQSATGICAGTYSVSVTDNAGCALTNTVSFTNPTVLSAAMSSSSASCGLCNGTASVVASGGTGSYTYSWSGFPVQTASTATGLCTGNYTVTLKDANNCVTTNTVSVGIIPMISDNASTTLTACGASTGAICVSPSGGVPGYTYLWSPGGATNSCIGGLGAAIYTVTISDAAGCSQPFAIALNNLSGPTVTVTSAVDPTCNASCNGLISVSAAGSNGPFTYSWNPGGQTTTSISALCAGTYILQVQDNVPCTTFSSTTLVNPAQMNVNSTITNVSCNGGNNGNICVAPSGGSAPYTYKWMPGGQTTSCVSGLTAGTYSVVFSDAIGCDDTVALSVTEPAILSVSVTSTNITCNGSGNGSATATVTGGTTLYTYAWSTGSALPGIVGLVPGPYNLTVTDGKGCIGTASVTITQPAVLSTTVSSTNISCNSLCDGLASLDASGGTTPYTYSWLPIGATTSTISGLCVGNYDGTLTDAHGCASTKSVSISEPSVLSATVTPVNSTCFGGCNGTASAIVNGGTGAYTYVWNPGGQTISPATGLCAGSQTLTVSDANGCAANTVFSISSPAQLQASIATVPPTCFGGCNGMATSSPVGGTGPYTFLWCSGQTTSTATGLCAGTCSLTLSDANGCSIVQTTNIIAPAPIAIASGVAGATCLVCNGSISIVSFGGTPLYTYAWLPGGETTASITGLCASLYTITVSDANGCSTKDTIPVSNTTGPSIAVTGTNISCFGFCNGTATVTATGNGPPWNYEWDTTPAQTTQTASGLCPNQYFISVTDVGGCTTIEPVNITQPSPLATNPVVTNATCFGICSGSITLNPSGGTPPYKYDWLPGGQTTTSISAQCVGNYTANVTDAHGCVLTTTMTVGQNTVLTSTVTSTNDSCNALCDGTAVINIFGGTLPYLYSWTGGHTSSSVTGLCAGTYTIVATDAVGCVRVDSAIINQPALLASNSIAVNPLCQGSCNGSLTAAPTGGTSPYTYLWNPGGETTSSITGLCAGNFTLTLSDANLCSAMNTFVLSNPTLISSTDVETKASCINTKDGSIVITPTGGTLPYTYNWQPGGMTTQNVTGIAAGIYSVTITDSHGCAFTDSMTVGVSTFVTAAAGKDTTFCEGGTVMLCNGSINATSITWYQIQNPIWTQLDTTTCINVAPFISTNYAIVATKGLCSDTDTVAVTIIPSPPVNAGSDATIITGGTAYLNGSGSGTFLWSPSTGLSCTTCANPTANPTVSTTYTLVINDTSGCSSYDTVRVNIFPIVVPNDGISPNGDGHNDVWVIPGIELFPECVVEVYNRWGELIFSSTGYKEKWDGTYKGKELPVGTYYYAINLNSTLSPDPITGPITILR